MEGPGIKARFGFAFHRAGRAENKKEVNLAFFASCGSIQVWVDIG